MKLNKKIEKKPVHSPHSDGYLKKVAIFILFVYVISDFLKNWKLEHAKKLFFVIFDIYARARWGILIIFDKNLF